MTKVALFFVYLQVGLQKRILQKPVSDDKKQRFNELIKLSTFNLQMDSKAGHIQRITVVDCFFSSPPPRTIVYPTSNNKQPFEHCT